MDRQGMVAAMPTPVMKRATVTEEREWERPNHRVESPTRTVKMVSVFLPPSQSESKPDGSCMMPYPSMVAAPSMDMSDADRLMSLAMSSARTVGAMR